MIVGIAGYAGAGKDTAALALTRLGWRQDSFAAPLKAMALDVNPWIRYASVRTSRVVLEYRFERLREIVDREGWESAKGIEEVRRVLQDLGVAARERIGEDVWVDALDRRFQAEHEALLQDVPGEYAPEPEVVVSDVRFPNEARIMDVLIWVDRPGVGPVNAHASDAGLVRHLCTHEIVNDGTREELWAKVRAAAGL